MKYNLTDTQSYDITELQKALDVAGVPNTGISGNGDKEFVIGVFLIDEAAADIVVQNHLLIDWNFERAKNVKKEEIRKAFYKASVVPVTVTVSSVAYTFNGGFDSSVHIDGAYRLASRTSATTVDLSDISNVTTSHPIADADTISIAIAQKFETDFRQKQNHMVAIDAALDQVGLDAIVWV